MNVALQCPYSGGNAVLQARTFIKLLIDTIEYDDIGICLQAGYYRQNNVKETGTIKGTVKIIPNPAKDEVTIKLQNSNDGLCIVMISDVLSNEIFNPRFNCLERQAKISLHNIPSAVYTLKVIKSDSMIETLKLIIIK